MAYSKSFFLSILCLFNLIVIGEAQPKCKECPYLSSRDTLVCDSGRCSIVKAGCRLVADNLPAGKHQIIDGHSLTSLSSTGRCSYNMSGKIITFTVK